MSGPILQYFEAEKTVRDYVCSQCWGHLVIVDDAQTRNRVECSQCKGTTFHSKHFVRTQQAADRDRAYQARQLGALVGYKPHTAAENLKALGVQA
jgi:DNA-directed RNA polymerase subunit RPC12/RpoP